jgi:hypothetical protein
MPKGIYKRIINTTDNLGNFAKKGAIPWNKGKKLPEEHINKLRKKSIGNKNCLGKHWKIKDTSRMHKSNNFRNPKKRAIKISKARKGIKFSEITIKKLKESHLGKKQTDITKKKCKESMKKQWKMGKRKIRYGKEAPNWKNGITPENKKIRNSIENNLWRESVFSRDNWTCQKYGIKGGKLHPHHIQNFAQFPELRFAIDNGITFSEKAHREFHKKYGIKNNTKEQVEEFLCQKK